MNIQIFCSPSICAMVIHLDVINNYTNTNSLLKPHIEYIFYRLGNKSSKPKKISLIKEFLRQMIL